MPGRLSGQHVLVVEDEPLQGWDLAGRLNDEGADVLGPAGSIAQALAFLSRAEISAAVLDWTLADGEAQPIAVVLIERNIPFLFHTATGTRVGSKWPQVPLVEKPHAQLIIPCLVRILKAV
jgi:DNA-binding response OmpR family regulator